MEFAFIPGMNRTASADWQGSVRTGRGKINTESGSLKENPFSFDTRFGDQKGTNPEELIGAALASCYSMALSAQLQKHKFQPEHVHTDVDVQMKQTDETWGVGEIRISTEVKAGDLSSEQLQTIAEETKRSCPIAKLLNAHMTVEARLASGAGLTVQNRSAQNSSDQKNSGESHAAH